MAIRLPTPSDILWGTTSLPANTYTQSNEKQFGHLYLPPGDGKHPVVIFIHGGCWLDEYDIQPVGLICKSLCEAGNAVWSIEYRRLGGGGELLLEPY